MRALLLATLVAAPALGQVVKTSSTASLPDCPGDNTYQVDVYLPSGGGGIFPTAVIGHGFQNSKDNHEALAQALAGLGILVVVPQLPTFLRCGTTDHARNARILLAALDGQAAAGRVDTTRVAFSGHSAGGLAAWLAAAQRDNVGVLLLDAVDQSALGAAQVANVTSPALFLFAEPAFCNSQSNSAAWFAPKSGPKGRLKVVGSAHCAPQNPVNFACSGGCGGFSAAHSAVFQTYAVSFFKRVLLNQSAPCLEDLAQADAAAGRVSEVDLRLGACGGADAGTGVDAGTGGGAGGGTGGGSGGDDAGTVEDADGGDGRAGPTGAPTGCGCVAVPDLGALALGVWLLASSRRRSQSRG